MTLYGVTKSSRAGHYHDENNNKPPVPPPLPPATPTTPRSATLKSTRSEFESINRQTSQTYCKHLFAMIYA